MPKKSSVKSTYVPQPSMESPYSLSAMARALNQNAGLLFLGAAILILGFVGGSLWMENRLLRSGLTVGTGTGTAATGATQATAQQPQQAAASLDQIKALFNGKHIQLGDANKKVLFVEVSDPSCPYCHIASGTNPELNKQAGAQFMLTKDGGTYVAPVEEMRKLVDAGQASFVWLYANGHGNGEMATKALYCANEKNRFWQAHDVLFTNAGYDFINNTLKNDKTKSTELADFLKGAVDPGFLKSCLDSGKYDAKIAEDQAVSASIGHSGTPGFYVNSTIFSGALSYTDMEPAVKQALQ